MRIYLLILFYLLMFSSLANAQNDLNPLSTSCNSWLKIIEAGGGVQIGDLDIPGNKVTVEAKFNRTDPYSGPYVYAGNIVSKHSDPNDANYLLRPGSAEVTTSNGYFITPEVCAFDLNKTYHVAMVYDGSTLKFYRNGYLLSQVACSGDLILNDFQTTIGQNALNMSVTPEEGMRGYIDEVRIWNVPRSQEQIRANMDIALPSPSTQPGLLAYYQFNDLINKQGNSMWDGRLRRLSTQINQTNPKCITSTDSCNVVCDKSTDFAFRQSLCNPNSIDFITDHIEVQNVRWDFGAAGISDSFTPTIDFGSTLQNIPVSLTTTFKDGCIAQIDKQISIAISGANSPVLTFDTTVCKGEEVTLRAPESFAYCWDQIIGNTETEAREQIIVADATRQYLYKRVEIGNNLIVNGNFESGNESFSSDYLFSSAGNVPGNYAISNNAKAWDSEINCELTSPASEMMLVNGEMITGTTIWKSTVTITPGTNYLFGFSIANLKTGNPRIHVYINGNKIDQAEFGAGALCSWQQYQIFWNSGISNEVELKLVTGLLPTGSNVFALDNMFLSEYKLFSEYININVEEIPSVVASDDAAICLGNKTILSVETDLPTVQWSPNSFINNISSLTPEVSPNVTTTYYVSAETVSGCKAIDSVQVIVEPKPIFAISSTQVELCEGEQAKITASGGTVYQWYYGGEFLSSSPILDLDGSREGDFSVIIKNELCNLSDTLTSIVNISPVPQISIEKSNDIDCKQTTALITANGAATFLWTSNSSIIENFGNSIKVAPSTNTVYKVEGTDPNGCSVIDSIDVVVVPGSANEEYKLANAFSPNGDGKNDCFGTAKYGALNNYSLTIWNRWGQPVFSSKNQSECWDGTLNGKRQGEGTYVYQLSGSSICGDVNKKGILQLVR